MLCYKVGMGVCLVWTGFFSFCCDCKFCISISFYRRAFGQMIPFESILQNHDQHTLYIITIPGTQAQLLKPSLFHRDIPPRPTFCPPSHLRDVCQPIRVPQIAHPRRWVFYGFTMMPKCRDGVLLTNRKSIPTSLKIDSPANGFLGARAAPLGPSYPACSNNLLLCPADRLGGLSWSKASSCA
jgi:hypothetical protein